MDSSRPSTLTPLQQEVLAAFFRHEQGFFLTGGAALAGYHLGHRVTLDLDLFTLDAAAFERGRHVLQAVADELGASLSIRQDAPGFRRGLLSRDGESVVVDLVLERVAQRVPTKPMVDGIRVDPLEEIAANKLCAIVGRAEERDLVDLWALEGAGVSLVDALPAALDKDGGATPANIAWLLSQVQLPPDLRLPAGVDARELSRFIEELVQRLRAQGLPGSPGE